MCHVIDTGLIAHKLKSIIIDKVRLHKLKSLGTAKETICLGKRNHREWERIFASYKSDRRLIFRNIKKLRNKKLEKQMMVSKMNYKIKQSFLKENKSSKEIPLKNV